METITFESEADKEIWECCNLDSPKSFFLFAGAGSGKTRSLIHVLDLVRKNHGTYLRLRKKRVGVITYTNAACEEIKHRLGHDSVFAVSTIHSFAWDLVSHFQKDIKNWVLTSTEKDIAEIQEEMAKGRAGTKAAVDRVNRMERKKQRLHNIDRIKHFVYSPTGDNVTKDSLNHSEVIQLTSYFLNKPLMQQLVVQRFPILFIDESQDTNKELIEALFRLQALHSNKFILGLFGDTMQRIYNDGKPHIERAIPPNWAKPLKKVNHRSPKRIIELINKIRSAVDDKLQEPKQEQLEGHVRIFITSEIENKPLIEESITKQMQDTTKDDLWVSGDSNVKVLILEHHMAARRMGFINLFSSLYECEPMRTGLLDGTLPGLRFFTKIILPLVQASENKDKFAIAHIVKQYSEFFAEKPGKNHEKGITLKKINEGVNSLLSLWKEGKVPTLLEIINNVGATGLFPLPDVLAIIYARTNSPEIQSPDMDEEENIDSDKKSTMIQAWDKALNCSFSEAHKFNEYTADNPRFGTHQGVKGLEFDRVMVIIDDREARGFSFSYNKLFTESTSKTSPNEADETSLDRTRRLFYVACSRARKSLAIVAYSNDPTSLRQSLLQKEWFKPNEIILL
jgi:DNA helicase-2/ATP-dependent DNA helicase PcrA